MQFTTKENEQINPEPWQWIADYGDSTGIRQFDYDSQQYHYFADIDNSRTKRFGLVNPETGKNVIIDIPEGAKLIHFYDNIVSQPMGGGEKTSTRLYCFGYELGSEKTIYAVLPNNFVVKGDPSEIGVI